MEDYMKECMRKLALWYTRTFKPIMTHDELEPIMATLGFVGLPPTSTPATSVAWKEYVYTAGGFRCKSVSGSDPPSKPRLPYPRIDGLHIYTYRAFIDAVCFYLEMSDISDLFHIRGMPLHRVQDKSRKWRKMEEDESMFIYREGTLEQATQNLYQFNKSSNNNNGNSNRYNSFLIRNRGNSASASSPSSCIVPLKDIHCGT